MAGEGQPLTEERLGQIALAFERDRMRNGGFPLNQQTIQEIRDMTSNVGIPEDELVEYVRTLLHEAVDEMCEPLEDSEPDPET